jgi:hypothetical protein
MPVPLLLLLNGDKIGRRFVRIVRAWLLGAEQSRFQFLFVPSFRQWPTDSGGFGAP